MIKSKKVWLIVSYLWPKTLILRRVELKILFSQESYQLPMVLKSGILFLPFNFPSTCAIIYPRDQLKILSVGKKRFENLYC